MPKQKANGKEIGPAKQRLNHDVIAIRSYEIYIARGASHEHDLDDWLQAERELNKNSKYSAPGRSVII